jgi:hypothetical protein
LTADERTAVMGWCLDHRNRYKVMSKTKFWALCTDFIREEFSKEMLHPGRMVKTWVDRRRQEIAREDGDGMSSGLAYPNSTEFRQRLAAWISFIDDFERPKPQDARTVQGTAASSDSQRENQQINEEPRARNIVVLRTTSIRSKRSIAQVISAAPQEETAEDLNNSNNGNNNGNNSNNNNNSNSNNNLAQTPAPESANPEDTTRRVRIKKEIDDLGTSAWSNFDEMVPMRSESARQEVQKVVKEEIGEEPQEIDEELQGVTTESSNDVASILYHLEAMRRETGRIISY